MDQALQERHGSDFFLLTYAVSDILQRPLKKGATEPGTPPGGLHGLRDLGSLEVTGSDRMVMVLVSDGDRMVMMLVGDGDSMVMVLVGHADRMVMVLVGDGYPMVTVLVEGGDW